MEILGINWIGIQTDKFEQTSHFYRNVLNLEPDEHDAEPGFIRFRTPNRRGLVEVFGPGSKSWEHFSEYPVIAGFIVADIEKAVEELKAAGLEMIAPLQTYEGYSWQIFRGPDGNLYELAHDPDWR